MTIPKPVAILLTLLGCATVTLILYLLGGQDDRYMSSYLLISLIAVIIGIASRGILTGETPWYSPHAIVLATLFAYYVAGSASLIYFRVPSHSTDRLISPEALQVAVFGTLVGVCSYLLGYRIGPKKKLLPNRLEWYFTDTPAVQTRFDIIVIGLFGMGMMAWVYMFAVGGGVQAHLRNLTSGRGEAVANAGGIIYHISKFAAPMSLLYLSRHGFKLITVGMMGAMLLVTLAFGSRNLVAMYVVSVAMVYRFRFGKIPLWVWPVGLAGLSFALTFMRILRGTGGNLSRAMYYQQKVTSTLEGRIEALVGDFVFINNWADVIPAMGDRIPYQLGRTFSEFLFIVPTFVWPDQYKYVKTGGQVYMENLAPHKIGFVSLSNNMMLDFFINFGWAGLIIMSMMLGIFVKWFQNAVIGHPHRHFQVPHIVASAVVATSLITMLKSGLAFSLNWVYMGFPLFVVYAPNLQHLLNPPPLPGAGQDHHHDHHHGQPAVA